MSKNIITAMLVLTSLAVFGQERNFGVSINQEFGVLTTAKQDARELHNIYIGLDNEESTNAKLIWHSNSLSFDWYLKNKFTISIGMRLFHFRTIQDSTRAQSSFQLAYGIRTSKYTDGTPFVKLGYIVQLSERWSLNNHLSIGYYRLILRNRHHSVPYNPNQEINFKGDNEGGAGWLKFRTSPKSFNLKVGSSISLNLGQFSLNSGLSYYYNSNELITAHHGLYLDLGMALRFKK